MRFFQQVHWQQWFRVAKSNSNIANLNPRQIYIIPTRWGLLYVAMLVLLLMGSINYSLSLGYYITFLLTALGHTAMLHTWRNLVHLQIEVLYAKPVFAGDMTQVSINMINTKNRARYAIAAYFSSNAIVSNDIKANLSTHLSVPISTQQRGYLSLPRLTLHTEFPLRLLHAWAYVQSPMQILVYPKPSGKLVLPSPFVDANIDGVNQANISDDDFNGHKSYQLGDAPSRVDWKASSRGIGMLSKLYSGASAGMLWLEFTATQGDIETRISQLTQWVLDAHTARRPYGLKLPSVTLAPSYSDAHYQACMQALALL